ncbi:helix-turn-helix transcriptional regulator [Rugosimonospora africana]|uniref:helix-turn-helix transcriptional regulator n=1 Tax=Rugosimonospora africana TaxID=556532 RepID=UPI001EF26B2A|nr:AAA family ATPase [Rugosimonospora africana]
MSDEVAPTVRHGRRSGESPVPRPPRFVGRGRELAALERALASAPVLVLVEGEGGIGKSRLLREFLRDRHARHRVLVAAAPPVRQPYTLGPVVDALQRATDGVGGLGLSMLAGALRPLFPEWGADLPPAPEPAQDAPAARHRLFRALAELIGRLQIEVLVMEDVHWADEATLEFLLFLTAQRHAPVSVVVTYRPEDVPSDSLLPRLSSRPPTGMGLLRLELGPLDVAQTASLVSSMLAGGQASAAFAQFLHERTEGVPLAVEESVRLMHDRADLVQRGGEWVRRRLHEIDVPPTVRDAVLERVRRLHPDAQAVLRAAAVLGEPGDPAVVLACAGLPGDPQRPGWSEALTSGLLGEAEAGLIDYRHALAGRAVYESMTVAERRLLHRRAGTVLESVPRPPAARLAWHFREARDTERWRRYAELAAGAALAAGDDATVVTLLYDLLVAAELPPAAVLALVERLPKVALNGPDRIGELVKVVRRVVATGTLTPNEAARLRFQLGMLLDLLNEFDASRAELEQAIPDLGDGSEDSVRAMLLLGWARGTTAHSQVHRQWLYRAAEATPLLPASARSAMTSAGAAGLLLLGEEEGWAAAAQVPDDTATVAGRYSMLLRDLNVGDLAMRWGRYAQARTLLRRGMELAELYQYLRHRAAALCTLIHLDWFVGGWSKLAERVDRLIEDDSVQATDRLECELVSRRLAAAAGTDVDGDVLRLMDEWRARGAVDCLMEPAAVLARAWLAAGRVDDALGVTEEPLAIVAHKEIWLWATELAPARVDALVAAGRAGDAASLVADFARGLRGRNMPAPAAGLALCRAILARGDGQPARAAQLFASAAAAWQDLPRPYDALLARERQAHCLLADGGSEAGLSLLGEVRQGLAELGATGDAERVTRTLRDSGVSPAPVWRGGRRGYGDRLSPRELEVVRLVVAGHTNRTIAQLLHRSPKTVASQVNSAMRKLDVSTRTALAVSAIEAGLIVADPPE